MNARCSTNSVSSQTAVAVHDTMREAVKEYLIWLAVAAENY
jgi:hypothetical protein